MSARTRVAMPQKTPTLIASLYDTVLVGLPPEDFFFGVFVGAMPPVYRPELRADPYGARGHNRRRSVATPSPRLAQVALTALESARPREGVATLRSEEHTSELQSRGHLVCRLLLEKKKRAS